MVTTFYYWRWVSRRTEIILDCLEHHQKGPRASTARVKKFAWG
jgi:hypothetical protein